MQSFIARRAPFDAHLFCARGHLFAVASRCYSEIHVTLRCCKPLRPRTFFRGRIALLQRNTRNARVLHAPAPGGASGTRHSHVLRRLALATVHVPAHHRRVQEGASCDVLSPAKRHRQPARKGALDALGRGGPGGMRGVAWDRLCEVLVAVRVRCFASGRCEAACDRTSRLMVLAVRHVL